MDYENYEVKNINGHFEVFCCGKVMCSGDTYNEAEDTYKEMYLNDTVTS